MRRLIIKLLLLIIPIELIVLLVNVSVDPAKLLSGEEYVVSIAEILSKGHNVDNISNYDERLLQKEYLKRIPNFDLAILGSSRIMELGGNNFPDKKTVNLGVSHANILDIVAIIGVMDSFNKMPKQLIINVDPFLLTENDEWQSLEGYFTRFTKKKFTSQPSVEVSQYKVLKKYFTLCSFEYFQSGLELLSKKKGSNVIDVDTATPKTMGRYADGSICYSYDYTHPDTAVVASVARRTALKTHLQPVDVELLNIFEQLLTYCQKNNISVTLIKVPYHQVYFDEMSTSQKNIPITFFDKLFIEIAQKFNLQIIGSFNPREVSITTADFYDMYHCSGTSISKMLKTIE